MGTGIKMIEVQLTNPLPPTFFLIRKGIGHFTVINVTLQQEYGHWLSTTL